MARRAPDAAASLHWPAPLRVAAHRLRKRAAQQPQPTQPAQQPAQQQAAPTSIPHPTRPGSEQPLAVTAPTFGSPSGPGPLVEIGGARWHVPAGSRTAWMKGRRSGLYVVAGNTGVLHILRAAPGGGIEEIAVPEGLAPQILRKYPQLT